MTREALRIRSAEYLNGLSLDYLFKKFGITRIANLTGLDQVGYPIYSVTRPLGQTVSVNAGKSLVPELSRAGAIAEGIEFHTFENPPKRQRRWIEKIRAHELSFDPMLLQWARGAKR